MIRVITSSKELSRKERYMLTLSNEVQMVQNLEDGHKIKPRVWAKYVDDETDIEILSIMDENNVVYATQSATFIKSFYDMVDIFEDNFEEFEIKKISGQTKAGRDFVNCTLVL